MTASASQVGRIREEVEELLAKSSRARSLDSFRKYRGKRALFAREVFGLELWDRQLEALELTDTARRVAVLSAHGIGKTLAEAVEVFYQTLVYGPCLVICISAVQSQMRHQTFGEMHKLFLRAKNLPGELYTDSYRLDAATRHQAIGLGTNEPGRLTGYHHDRLVVIVDEAHGLPDVMWDAVLALAVGEHDRVLALGNPGPPVGRWYTIAKSAGWAHLTIPSTSHPNVVTGRNVIPGAITRTKIAEYAADHGVNSPTYRRLVEGLFTEDASEIITTTADLERAAVLWEREMILDADRRRDETYLGPEYVIGVDPARLGPDLTALCIAEGPSQGLASRGRTLVREFITWGQTDTMVTVGRIQAEAKQRGINYWEDGCRLGWHPGRFIVDEPGVGGGVVDRLKERGYTVIPFNGARAVAEEEWKDPKRYKNLRAAAYWSLRKMLEAGTIAVPRNDRLWEELLSTEWEMGSDEKIMIRPKEELRDRLGRSPDLADSLSLVAYWMGKKRMTSLPAFITF